jgi:hypothetical protein
MVFMRINIKKRKKKREALKVANDDYTAMGIDRSGGAIGRRDGDVLGRGDDGDDCILGW